MFSIWMNGILSSLDILRLLQIFLALVKALPTYIWKWLAKRSSSSICSACGDSGLKQTRKIFSNKCPCIFSTWPNWMKEVFLGRGRQEWCKVKFSQIELNFKRLNSSFCEIWIIPPPFLLSFRTPKYCLDKFCG